ncbi:MAG: class I SAM-dependent methyltransferase [Bacteroidota bacterium]
MTKIGYWIFRISALLRWYGQAKTRYDIHSPYLSDFIEASLQQRQPYFPFALIQQVRKYWSKHPGEVGIMQQGAPSKITTANVRKINQLVTKSAIPTRWGEFLFRTALFNRARHIIELGTNAGISTLYLHYADRRAQLHTIEGNPQIAALAKHTFKITHCQPSLQQYVGTFSDTLPLVLQQTPQVDLLFIDGDHRYATTIDYVNQCIPKATPDSIFIVADIHWSTDMERAWEELTTNPVFAASLDLGYFGVLFFQPAAKTAQHFKLISTRWKPWRIGLF